MAKLSVLITEKFPASLRGEITRWMIEVKSGVFIGTLSRLVRDLLWEKIEKTTKVKNQGGAILIEPAANEQKYQIKSCGNFSRIPRNIEGLNLMSIPPDPSVAANSSQNKEKDANKSGFNPFTYFANRLDIKPGMSARINWSVPKNLPPNFVSRTFSVRFEGNQFISHFSAQSSYFEYPPERVWSKKEVEEITKIGQFCLDLWNICLKEQPENISEKILSFALETTDYSPKASEGYVNVIGLCSLHFSQETHCPTLVFHQGFNMTRQRTNAAALLYHFWSNFQNASQVIVWDKNKDLSQFSLLAKENKLACPEFKRIFDVKENSRKIEEFIEEFNTKTGMNLTIQSSAKFSEYYQLFKGDEKTQINKNLIPIGRFNFLKILLGLYFHFLQDLDSSH